MNEGQLIIAPQPGFLVDNCTSMYMCFLSGLYIVVNRTPRVLMADNKLGAVERCECGPHLIRRRHAKIFQPSRCASERERSLCSHIGI